MTARATLDRVVDGEQAVVLLEDDGVVDQLVVDVERLLADGRLGGVRSQHRGRLTRRSNVSSRQDRPESASGARPPR